MQPPDDEQQHNQPSADDSGAQPPAGADRAQPQPDEHAAPPAQPADGDALDYPDIPDEEEPTTYTPDRQEFSILSFTDMEDDEPEQADALSVPGVFKLSLFNYPDPNADVDEALEYPATPPPIVLPTLIRTLPPLMSPRIPTRMSRLSMVTPTYTNMSKMKMSGAQARLRFRFRWHCSA
ncbi:MAG: hypothetical protein HC876_10810 [Chloroflexaceae bacterium]|nr:hypothetical protein [Chloroflexaceae bacterium]